LHGRKGGLVRDSIADSESFRSASQGGRLQSEWVADFRRNRWPDCVGISGRLPSDYACIGAEPLERASGGTVFFAKLRTILYIRSAALQGHLNSRQGLLITAACREPPHCQV